MKKEREGGGSGRVAGRLGVGGRACRWGAVECPGPSPKARSLGWLPGPSPKPGPQAQALGPRPLPGSGHPALGQDRTDAVGALAEINENLECSVATCLRYALADFDVLAANFQRP